MSCGLSLHPYIIQRRAAPRGRGSGGRRKSQVAGQSHMSKQGVATGNRDCPQYRRSCSPATSSAAQTPNHALAPCKQHQIPLLSLSQVPHVAKPPNCPIPISVRLPGSVAFWLYPLSTPCFASRHRPAPPTPPRPTLPTSSPRPFLPNPPLPAPSIISTYNYLSSHQPTLPNNSIQLDTTQFNSTQLNLPHPQPSTPQYCCPSHTNTYTLHNGNCPSP